MGCILERGVVLEKGCLYYGGRVSVLRGPYFGEGLGNNRRVSVKDVLAIVQPKPLAKADTHAQACICR